MRKHTVLSLFITLCLLASCSPKYTEASEFTEFTFVQMTDPQIGFRDKTPGLVQSDSLFSKAVEAVNALKPKCVIITGDLINDAYDKYQDSIYRANRSKIKAEVYEIPGNHDIRPWTLENFVNYLRLRDYGRFFIRKFGCAFIGIDSNCIIDNEKDQSADSGKGEHGRSGPRRLYYIHGHYAADMSELFIHNNLEIRIPFREEYTSFIFDEALTLSQADGGQIKWLENALKEARQCKYIFVFLHCPVIRESIDEENDYFNFPKGDKKHKGPREKYIELFKKYGVDVVFAGHTHMDYDTTVDGIRFVTAGPVGSPLGRGYSGYEVVTVTNDGVDCKYVATPGVYQKLPEK